MYIFGICACNIALKTMNYGFVLYLISSEVSLYNIVKD